MEPHEYPRRILLSVSGLSPQIITETLYALAVEGNPSFVPTEIHLVTTAEGAERARLQLLSNDPGWLHRLRRDYDLPAILFDKATIHVLHDVAGQALADIRTPADNERAADEIIDVMRVLTADTTSALHVSIAGGRKTMGFYLGYALSLFGRPQDRLSHVLVSTSFESHPLFFYPTRESRVIYDRDNRPLDTREAIVTLAEIPFVRLRDGLPEDLLAGSASFSMAVARAQQHLGPPELVLDARTRRVRCGGTVVNLKPIEFGWLAWFARRASQSLSGLNWREANAEEFMAEYRALHDELSGEYERTAKGLQNGISKEFFWERNSDIKSAMINAMGKVAAQPYLIISDGKRPRSHYRLQLSPEQIRFESLA